MNFIRSYSINLVIILLLVFSPMAPFLVSSTNSMTTSNSEIDTSTTNIQQNHDLGFENEEISLDTVSTSSSEDTSNDLSQKNLNGNQPLENWNRLDSGTLQIKTTSQKSPIPSHYTIQQRNEQTHEYQVVQTGQIDESGITQLTVIPGTYKVTAKSTNSMESDEIVIQAGDSKNVELEFIPLELQGYTLFESYRSVDIAIEDNKGQTIWERSDFNYEDSETLHVSPDIYYLQSSNHIDQNKVIDATIPSVTPVFMPESNELQTRSIGVDQEASFGELEFFVDTVNGMPLSGVSIKIFNASSGEQLYSRTTNNQGKASDSVNPITYDVQIYYSSIELSIWNTTVEVNANEVTTVELTLSRITAYTQNDEYIYLKNSTTESTYYSIRSYTSGLVRFYTPTDLNFTVSYATGPSFNVTTSYGKENIVGNRTNYAPIFDSVSHTGRVNANEESNITISVKDHNLDYPLTMRYYPNHGVVNSQPLDWIQTGVLGVTVTFIAPNYDDFYQLDFGLEDQDGDFNNYTLYLSDRESIITFNATAENDRPLDIWIYMYESNTGSNLGGVRTYGDGEAQINLHDGEYYFRWTVDHPLISDDYLITNDTEYYTFTQSFSEITINTTAQFGKIISANYRIYNETDGMTQILSSTTSASTGLRNVVVPAYNYTIKSYRHEPSSLWDNVETVAGQKIQVDFTFGVIAAYAFSGENPQDIWTYLYNETDGQSFVASGRTYGDGLTTYTVAAFDNYTLYFNRNGGEYYYNISVDASDAVAVGDFTNSNPIISDISASPERIIQDENTTISVSASDIDPIDKLDYSWEANVGTIEGSGDTIIYIAPSELSLYRVDVNVTDQFGGSATIHIYVSDRLSDITANVTEGNGDPSDQWVYLKRIRDGQVISSGRTYGDGLFNFNNIYDDEYELYNTRGNRYSHFFLANQSTYLFNFTWSEVRYNTTTAGNPFSSTVRIYDNETMTQQTSSSTSSTTGLRTFFVTPGNYSLSATSTNTKIWKRDKYLGPNALNIYDFKFAHIKVNVTSTYGNQMDIWTYLYNETSQQGSNLGSSRTYADGIGGYNVAPGNYSILYSVDPDYEQYNVTTELGDYIEVELKLGVVTIYTNDGQDPISENVRIYKEGEGSYFLSLNTGQDGFVLRHILAGTYDFEIGGSWTYGVVIPENGKITLGNKLNNAPIINSISTTGRIGSSQTTTVTLDVSDKDYDYANLQLEVEHSIGTTNLDLDRGFVSNNEYRLRFNYTSPEYLDTYILNITLSDSSKNDTYYLVVSDQDNLLNLESLRGEDQPQSTSYKIINHESGNTDYSGSTDGTTGKDSFYVKDGYYNIEFSEGNDIIVKRAWLIGGNTFNITARFGEVDIYSTGAGGVPKDNWVYVYNQTTDEFVTSGRTYSDGLVTFVLAPGDYKFRVDDTVDIILYGTVYAGKTSIFGSEVPDLYNNPEVIDMYYGSSNQVQTWKFEDSNPDWYRVLLDGILYENGTWDGDHLDIDFSGIAVGSYDVEIYVNDTYGYYNFDTATLNILSPGEPQVNSPADQSIAFNGSTSINWEANSSIPDNFTVYRNSILYDTGYWNNGTLTVFISNYLTGTYNFTLVLEDELNRTSVDTVIITVGEDPLPQVTNDGNQELELGNDPIPLNWTISDNNPNYYEIYVNGILYTSAPASEGTYEYIYDPNIVGSFNVSFVIFDHSGNATRSTVYITVSDTTEPTVSDNSDMQVDYNTEEVILDWEIFDYSTTTYELYVNGELNQTGTVTGNLTVNLGYLTLGMHEINLTVYDLYDNTEFDIFTVEVIDSQAPVITSIDDQSILLNETFPVLNWTITDNGQTNYSLFLNGELIQSGSNPENIVYLHDLELLPGNYSFELVVEDDSGNITSTSVVITVEEDDLLFIEAPEDIIFLASNSSSLELEFEAFSYIADNYTIMINDSIVVTSGEWSKNETVYFDLSGYIEGNSLLQLSITIQNNLGQQEIHHFDVEIVTEQELSTFLEDLTALQIMMILAGLAALLAVIVRFSGEGTGYGRIMY